MSLYTEPIMHTSLSQDTNGTTSIFWQAYETLLQNMLEYNVRETRIQLVLERYAATRTKVYQSILLVCGGIPLVYWFG
ncbi:hypothetical protein M0802_000733 [Mischocyttarus mexicanus]|nr:hypothetical protein M0802_000733 [Mischocyttarus mexicanus]